MAFAKFHAILVNLTASIYDQYSPTLGPITWQTVTDTVTLSLTLSELFFNNRTLGLTSIII